MATRLRVAAGTCSQTASPPPSPFLLCAITHTITIIIILILDISSHIFITVLHTLSSSASSSIITSITMIIVRSIRFAIFAQAQQFLHPCVLRRRLAVPFAQLPITKTGMATPVKSNAINEDALTPYARRLPQPMHKNKSKQTEAVAA